MLISERGDRLVFRDTAAVVLQIEMGQLCDSRRFNDVRQSADHYTAENDREYDWPYQKRGFDGIGFKSNRIITGWPFPASICDGLYVDYDPVRQLGADREAA